jgi:LysM repeat protein
VKALVILLLAFVIFGTGAYFTWELFFRPQQELKLEKLQPPPPPPPDPTLPEYQKCLAVEQSGNLLEARTVYTDFIERYPESTKIDDAKNRLGEINTRVFLSTMPAPEKQVYVVKSGDVLDRVARQTKTTSEYLVRANNIQPNAAGKIILRIGQKLTIASGEFSLMIDRQRKKVVLLKDGKFFKQYPIVAMPAQAALITKKGAATPKPSKVTGRVADRVAWKDGTRVTVADKGFLEADHWIVISPSSHSLFTHHEPNDGSQFQKPPGGGYALAPEHMRELAAMLQKNDPVSIE